MNNTTKQNTLEINGQKFVIKSWRKRAGFSVTINSKLYHVNTLDRAHAENRAFVRYMNSTGEIK